MPNIIDLSFHINSSVAEGNNSLTSSLAENVTLADSLSGNITMVNNTVGQNSSADHEAHNSSVGKGNRTLNSFLSENVTLANNPVWNTTTLANNTAGQNTSRNITVANKQGNLTANNDCFKTKYFSTKAFVKSFAMSYSDNGKEWKMYYEGGEVKVCF